MKYLPWLNATTLWTFPVEEKRFTRKKLTILVDRWQSIYISVVSSICIRVETTSDEGHLP